MKWEGGYIFDTDRWPLVFTLKNLSHLITRQRKIKQFHQTITFWLFGTVLSLSGRIFKHPILSVTQISTSVFCMFNFLWVKLFPPTITIIEELYTYYNNNIKAEFDEFLRRYEIRMNEFHERDFLTRKLRRWRCKNDFFRQSESSSTSARSNHFWLISLEATSAKSMK